LGGLTSLHSKISYEGAKSFQPFKKVEIFMHSSFLTLHKMLTTNDNNAKTLQSLPDDSDELEKLFSDVVLFDQSTRKQRAKLIDNVVACMLSLGITQINTGTELYRSLFLWYIKYSYKDNGYMFEVEENKQRFQSVYDMEVDFRTMLCQNKKSCHLWRSRERKCFFFSTTQILLIIYSTFQI